MKRYPVLLVLALAALVVAGNLSGCTLGRGEVYFYRDDGGGTSSFSPSSAMTRGGGGFRVSQLNITTSATTGIPTIWAEDDQGNTVPIQVRDEPTCIIATPAGGDALQVEGVESGTAVIETVDQIATLPVVVYNIGMLGWPGYTFHGFTVLADGSHISTEDREAAHFYDEWRAEANGNQWKTFVPAYIADPGVDSLGANHERIAAVKTVDIERFANAPAEQWLEANRIYVCQVPDGYVKVANTSQGVIWLFSPTPEFP